MKCSWQKSIVTYVTILVCYICNTKVAIVTYVTILVCYICNTKVAIVTYVTVMCVKYPALTIIFWMSMYCLCDVSFHVTQISHHVRKVSNVCIPCPSLSQWTHNMGNSVFARHSKTRLFVTYETNACVLQSSSTKVSHIKSKVRNSVSLLHLYLEVASILCSKYYKEWMSAKNASRDIQFEGSYFMHSLTLLHLPCMIARV